jgi:preprotein translocase subunit SecG
VFEELKKISTAAFRGRSIPVAMLLILVVLLSAGSGLYAGASFFPQQAPNVTITTTIFTTTTSWTTSTI